MIWCLAAPNLTYTRSPKGSVVPGQGGWHYRVVLDSSAGFPISYKGPGLPKSLDFPGPVLYVAVLLESIQIVTELSSML
jgi:hypothetical protein